MPKPRSFQQVAALSLLGIALSSTLVHAFNPSATSPWGVTKTASGTRLFAENDDNFDGVDLVRLLGLRRMKKKLRKSQREHNKRFREEQASAMKAVAAQGSSESSSATAEKADGPPKIIIAGAPASGKGTQCELIKEKFGVVHLSTGDMLRAAVAAESDVGKLAKEYMESGKLVPDDVIIGAVKDRLNDDDCRKNGWLLDGFPRTPGQANALAEAGISADCFIFLNVPDEDIVERVVGRRTDPETGKIYHMTFSPPDDEEILARLEQRIDDTEEKIKVRLEQFHANVDAVKGNYEDISVEIDGTGKPDTVGAAIDKALSASL